MSIILGTNPHLAVSKTDVTVDLDAQRDGAGVKFTPTIHSHGSGDKIKLPKDSGPYKITFYLHAKSGLNIRFDAGGPFFCAADDGSCPPTGTPSDQIMVDSCTDDKLVVIDWNYGAEQDLRYQVNFVDSAGKAMPDYDPIIQNGGGTKV